MSISVSPFNPVQQAGVRAKNPPDLVIASRAPTTTDFGYFIGQLWVNMGVSGGYYGMIAQAYTGPGTGTGTWVNFGTSASGAIATINTISPDGGGNFGILGTADEITVTGGVNKITLSVPSTFIAPGSIAATSTITAGTGLTVTTGNLLVSTGNITATSGNIVATSGNLSAGGTLAVTGNATLGGTLGVTGATTLAALTQVGTTNINATGAATTTIGTGGTGAVHIGNATGNTAVTGSLTASTTLTATLGAITATNGNLVLAHTGNKLVIHATTAASDSVGISAAMSAGTVTVSTTAVTASSIILLSPNTPGGTQGNLSVGTITAGVSFVINSDNSSDTSTVSYLIIN